MKEIKNIKDILHWQIENLSEEQIEEACNFNCPSTFGYEDFQNNNGFCDIHNCVNCWNEAVKKPSKPKKRKMTHEEIKEVLGFDFEEIPGEVRNKYEI